MSKDILYIAATHGDEPIGVEVLRSLEESGLGLGFDWIIGNQPALDRSVRFIDTDLNRSAPGNANSCSYEGRRAVEVIEKSKWYRYTIDIHGSSKETGIFIIITKPSLENFKLAALLDIEKVVIWPSLSKEMTGPLSEYFNCGLEIECGKKDDQVIKAQLEKILTDFLKKDLQTASDWRKRLEQKQVFEMYGSLKRSECADPVILKEFSKTNVDGEVFYPVFIGSYDYGDVLCYKLRPFDSSQIVSLE